jgi:hypothetical protein
LTLALLATAAACGACALFDPLVPGRAPRADPRAVFGINLSMYGPDARDQFIENPKTRSMFARPRVPFVRIPIRAGTPLPRLRSAMEAVKATHAAPVVILHGAMVPDSLAADRYLLGLVRSVFGSSRVYLEIGNEEDQAGVDAARYTATWNAIVGRLRRGSPASYLYGGPVTGSADPSYLAYFVGHARPRPNFVAWHEYACGPADSDSYCVSHIARWGVHVAQANARLRAAIGATLPIMITEWNLDAAPDPRYGDAPFIGRWVTAATAELERLRDRGLIGALYYTASANEDALVNPDGSFTPEGAAWHAALLAAARG